MRVCCGESRKWAELRGCWDWGQLVWWLRWFAYENGAGIVKLDTVWYATREDRRRFGCPKDDAHCTGREQKIKGPTRFTWKIAVNMVCMVCNMWLTSLPAASFTKLAAVSGTHVTHSMTCSCSRSSVLHSPELTTHTRMVWSLEQLAIREPSADTRTIRTHSWCPTNVFTQ